MAPAPWSKEARAFGKCRSGERRSVIQFDIRMMNRAVSHTNRTRDHWPRVLFVI
jgi:hypothetical protein